MDAAVPATTPAMTILVLVSVLEAPDAVWPPAMALGVMAKKELYRKRYWC